MTNVVTLTLDTIREQINSWKEALDEIEQELEAIEARQVAIQDRVQAMGVPAVATSPAPVSQPKVIHQEFPAKK